MNKTAIITAASIGLVSACGIIKPLPTSVVVFPDRQSVPLSVIRAACDVGVAQGSSKRLDEAHPLLTKEGKLWGFECTYNHWTGSGEYTYTGVTVNLTLPVVDSRVGALKHYLYAHNILDPDT